MYSFKRNSISELCTYWGTLRINLMKIENRTNTTIRGCTCSDGGMCDNCNRYVSKILRGKKDKKEAFITNFIWLLNYAIELNANKFYNQYIRMKTVGHRNGRCVVFYLSEHDNTYRGPEDPGKYIAWYNFKY